MKIRLVLASALISSLISACGNGAKQSAAPPAAAPTQAGVMTFAQFAELDSLVETVADTCTTSTCKALRQELRYTVYVGKQIYCWWEVKKAERAGFDWDKHAAALEASITDTTTLTDYVKVMQLWAGSFHDGHVNFLLQADTSDIDIFTAPVRFELLAPGTDHEQLIVSQVTKDADPIKVGDVVTMINGKTPVELLDAKEPYLSGSTKRMRRFFGARKLADALGPMPGTEVLTLVVQRADKTMTATLPRTAPLYEKPTTAAPESTGAELFAAQVLPGGWGYLRIDGFSGTQDSDLLNQAMDRLSATKGLILDLRKNGGGDQSGSVVLARMIKKAIVRYAVSERLSDFMLSQRPDPRLIPNPGQIYADWRPVVVQPAADRAMYVGKPIVALTSPNCFSACDTFAAALRGNKLAYFIGEGTGGGTGTPLVFELPITGSQFRYSVVRGITPEKKPIEGVGTMPDLTVEPTAADRVAGRDSQLIAAVQYLVSTTASANSSAEEIAASIRTVSGPTWMQDIGLSPTLEEDRALKRIARQDEL